MMKSRWDWLISILSQKAKRQRDKHAARYAR
jgi:hypothetical protein